MKIDKEWVEITCNKCKETYTFSYRYFKQGRAKKCAECGTSYKKSVDK